MLRSRDPDELDVWAAVHREAANVLEEITDKIARKIVKEYADAQKRGQKGSGG